MSRRDDLKEHLVFASELGVTGISRDATWRTRESSDPKSGSAAQTPAPHSGTDPQLESLGSAPQFGQPVVIDVVARSGAADTLPMILTDIGPDCSRCKLHTLGRKQIVFGVGNPNADLMFVGEAPGADEDEQGIPFVGRAGQLLTKIIEAIELKREDVYIANVIKCRPPQNRNPEPDEVETCEPFLFRQIDVIKPKVIVTLGKFAAQSLLRTDTPISRLRGQQFEYRGAKLVPTFHPAYVLRNNTPNSEVRRQVWEDMKLVRSLLMGSEPQ